MSVELVGYACFFLTMALTYAIICLGLNVQWGQTGLFNVGVAGFVAIGAYVSALLTTPDAANRLGGFDLPIVAWLARRGAGGRPRLVPDRRADHPAASRLSGHRHLRRRRHRATRRAQRSNRSPAARSASASFRDPSRRWPAIRCCSACSISACSPRSCIVLYLALERLVRSPWGRVLRAIREDEAAARALGKSATKFRLQAFAIGGGIMGLAGAAQAHFIGFIAPDNYMPMLTFQVWAMLIVGGSGNNRGAILGAVLVWGIWAGSAGARRRSVSGRPAGARRVAADRHDRRRALRDPASAPARHSRRGARRVAPSRQAAACRGASPHATSEKTSDAANP